MRRPQATGLPLLTNSSANFEVATLLPQLKSERGPVALPIGACTGGRRHHVHGLHKPHSARPQMQSHTAVVTRSGGKFLGWILPVHRNHQRTRQGTAFVHQADGKVLASADGVRVSFGDQLERKTEYA